MDNPVMSDFTKLLQGYLDESLSPEELGEFFALCGKPENNLIVQEVFQDFMIKKPKDLLSDIQTDEAWEKVQNMLGKELPRIRSVRPVIRWVAASIILVLSFTAIFVFRRPAKTPDYIVSTSEQKPPGWLTPEHMGAMLYLSGGNSVALNSLDSGLVAKDGDKDIFQYKGTIRYFGGNENAIFNEVRTGRGKIWRIILPDQTLVWLNSGSSIRYPLQMTRGTRSVEISGEVYFEVAHHEGQSFLVKTAGQEVEDVGTTFNISTAGVDHKTITTLVSGAVLVKTAGKQVSLIPGEQTVFSRDRREITVEKNVNLDATLAWKNGRFYFQNAVLNTVMQQVSDWYNVEIVYQRKASGRLFNGQIDKTLTLPQVLQGLRQQGVNFTTDSLNRIVVY